MLGWAYRLSNNKRFQQQVGCILTRYLFKKQSYQREFKARPSERQGCTHRETPRQKHRRATILIYFNLQIAPLIRTAIQFGCGISQADSTCQGSRIFPSFEAELVCITGKECLKVRIEGRKLALLTWVPPPQPLGPCARQLSLEAVRQQLEVSCLASVSEGRCQDLNSHPQTAVRFLRKSNVRKYVQYNHSRQRVQITIVHHAIQTDGDS